VRAHAASNGLIWAEGRLRLDRFPQRRPATFFPCAVRIPRETRKSSASRPPLRCGPTGAGPSAPGLPIAIESQWRGPKQQETTMATIGTFTATGNGFTGVVKTLTLNVKTAKLVSNEKDNEKAPDFRIFVGTTEFGAAWKKTARETGRDYLSVKLDDPSFPAPIYASLVEGEEQGTLALIWSRRNAD
jgi:uncharacterized protein (DUF736 family)